MEYQIILRSIIVLISAILGASLIFFMTIDHRKLCSLISFSAGALFGAAVFTLLPESFEYINTIEIFLSFFSGYFLFWVLSRYFAHVCPACSASHFDEQTTRKFSEIALTLTIALSVHSFLDGLAISTEHISLNTVNNSVFFAIAVHKFPEGLALASLMFSSDYARVKIFRNVFLIEFTTVIGALTGIYLFETEIPHYIMAIILAHISGGFIYLSLHAVVGEMFKNHKPLVIISFIIGLLLIMSVRLFL